MKYLISVSLLLLAACSTSKKIVKAEENLSLPELPVSEMDIPVKIAAAPILEKAEKLVPLEFTSDSWPEFLRPSCDFKYKYRFLRTGLQLTCVNNQIGIKFSGNYQVSGSKCLCTAGIPVTPWIYGNCGFPPQSLRRVSMALNTSLQFLPGYQVRTTTSILQVQPLDKCSVSVFSNDITQMVMDSIRSSLASFSQAMDQTIAGLNFSKFTSRIRDSSYKKIAMGPYGYFLLNPSAVRIGQLNLQQDSFAISLGVSCHPSLSSDPVNHQRVPSALPALLQTENRSGARLYVNMNYDYSFLTRILKDSLNNRVFEVKGRTLVVKDISIRGIGQHQIEIRVDFAGSNHGTIYLTGTPALDSAKQTISIPDIRYSMEDVDFALKIARSLFRNKIRNTIQGKSYLDVSAWLNANRPLIDTLLNREWITGMRSTGNLKEAKILAMLVTGQNIQVQVYLAGEIRFSGGNL